MRVVIVKWVSLVALALALVFWTGAGSYQFGLNLVVCSAAMVVSVQAFRLHRPFWAVPFILIALFFNPVLPTFSLSGGFALAWVSIAAACFGVSLHTLRSTPVLSMPSITDRNPGSRSL